MVDRVKPLKMEDTTNGSALNFGPKETDPSEDYLAAKGLALENSDLLLIDAAGNEIQFTDPVNGTKSVSDLLDAEQEDFDPLTSGLSSTKTGPAIRELAASLTSNDFALFSIWGEENAGIANNAQEYSFGNGATGAIGITLPIDAQLIAISYQADTAGTNSEVAVTQNNTNVATTGAQSTETGYNTLVTPIQFVAGDIVGFRTVIGGGAVDVRPCAWFRVPINTLLDVGLDDLNDVTIVSEATDQLLQYNGTQWVNIDPTDLPFYTQTQLDAGQLDTRYYTETELDAGQLDNRYYTETELDAGQLDNRYYTETELDAGQLDNRYYTETEIDAQQLIQDNDIIELELNQDDLVTLSGVAENSTDLGTFSGTTIPDNQTNKQALQALETELELHEADTANPHSTTFTQAVTADAGTDITASEAEELTDGSTTALHDHRELVDETGTHRVEALNGGDVQISNYPQTRNDTTSNDEKVLTTDISGNIVLRRVLPFQASISKVSDNISEVGINQTTTLEIWLELAFVTSEAGNYDLDWNYIWSHNDGAQDFIGEIRLDGVAIVDHRQEPKDAAGGGINLINTTGGSTNSGTNQRHSYSGFLPERTLTLGAHTLQILWAGSQNNDEATIYRGALRVRRTS